MLVFSAAVEGPVDEAVVRRVLKQAGAGVGPVYGRHGKSELLNRLSGYNQAAYYAPWLVLVDLDHDAGCAPPARARWLPSPALQMCFRIAVREVEAWLLADRQQLAAFLSVSVARVPLNPEMLDDPKRTLVDLARLSRRRDIRVDMAPRPESGRAVGPAYTSRIIEFVQTSWQPEVAMLHADSLRRLYERVQQAASAAQAGDASAS